jgi:predicted permease
MLGQPVQEVSGGTPLPSRGGDAVVNVVASGWFRTLGTSIVRGRDISDADRIGTAPVAIVNQAFARRFLNGANPVGHNVKLFLPGPPPPPIEVVGLAADAVYGTLRDPEAPTIYLPLAQLGDLWLRFLSSINLSARSSGDRPELLAKSVGAAIAAVNPELALTFHTLNEQLDASLAQERLIAQLSGFFGGLAMLLAALGLYGVTAYAVTRRTHEIGIRMAIGAAPAAILNLVLVRILVLTASGVVIGVVASLWAVRYIGTLLYGIEARDPTTFLAATAVLTTVVVLAAWHPAWRASRVDPATTLRCE